MAKYQTRCIQIDENTPIFVEVEDVNVDLAEPGASGGLDEEGLPIGAERTSRVSEHIGDALDAIENHVRAFSGVVRRGFESAAPDEFTLEFQIGFKGTSSPIPVVLSGEASGALKVTAKWTSISRRPPKSAP